MAEQGHFTEIQYAFTRHMRDPETQPAPADIEERRVGIYRDLLYRNVESFMANSYPVLRKITADDDWHAMIRDYFMRHESHTPLFPKMPQEFLQYLEQERQRKSDPPFLLELAHYEWVEMAVSIDVREIDWHGIDEHGDLLAGIPVISPLAWTLSYRFPVQKISPDFLPDEAPDQPTYLVVYRDRHDEVGFLELNPVSARLLEMVKDDMNLCGRDLLQTIANELQHPNPEIVIQGGLQIMEQMRSKDVLLGVKQGS